MSITRVLAGLFIFTSIVSCTKAKNVSEKPSESADLINTRPQAEVADLYLITLREPALMKSAVKSLNGDWQISETAKQALLTEQAAFEQALKAASPGAEIIFHYYLTINGLAIYAPWTDIPKISNLPQVQEITHARKFARPMTLPPSHDPASPGGVTSATFIGAEEAYAMGITGRGLRVGVLDTGADYTHAMLGGKGDPAEFAAIDPALPTPLFPNSKVTGGIDLVGSEFDASSPVAGKTRPVPDSNPLDESGHGSHVAGTIAGIGDGVTSFDGVAKDAEIVAIKVFGKDGSTMDAVVIRGFEYALDPNGDFNLDDQLDVVNLSLGGGYGPPQILYTEAVRNLVKAGVVMVASAGNSGPEDYIVGAPSTADEALSVAATVDGSDHNWKFPAAQFTTPTNPDLLVRIVEGAITKPISESNPVQAELVDLGLADVDLTPEQVAAVSGKVAFISRGTVPFSEKIRRAQDAGAIGVVVYNNAPGSPFVMGGEGEFQIPGFMISQDLGLSLLAEMKTGPVVVNFQTGRFIEERDRIDTVTDFSSKGPRSEDNLIKPEIAAPGAAIISAQMGSGKGVVEMGGTSMAAPHMSGAMALLKQKYPSLSALELKALAMNTAKILANAQGEVPVSLQGAGRVQIGKALTSPILVEPGGLSLGQVAVEDSRSQKRFVKVKNLLNREVQLTIATTATPGLTLKAPASITIAPGSTADVEIEAVFSVTNDLVSVAELDGRILFSENGVLVAQVPALAIRTLASNILSSATVGGLFISLTNSSPREGMALAFNLLGEDEAKKSAGLGEEWMGRSCDLQSVGYRVIRKTTEAGEREVIQFGFKLYQPVTTWHLCEPVILIDADGDGLAEQELGGVSAMGIEGMENFQFASVLLNATQARAIRATFEQDVVSNPGSVLDFSPAALSTLPMAPFNHSTLAVIEAPLDLIARGSTGMIRIQAATLYQYGDNIEGDDYLGVDNSQWQEIAPLPLMHPYFGMEEFTAVPSGTSSLSLQRGTGTGKLILYYPMNAISPSLPGSQYQIFD